MRTRCSLSACAAIGAIFLSAPAVAVDFDADGFDKHIRPILSNHCYQCHGPDANHREAGLRFDVAESATTELESGDTAIVPGDATSSELVARIFHDDEYAVMPPPETNKPLSKRQKQLLVDWINAGAPFAQHWSLVTPTKPEPPPTVSGRVANEIDQFVLAALDRAAANAEHRDDPVLSQSPRADKRTLLRRVTLDLIGLPPTPEQLAAFEADQSPEAFENVVDELLASEHYGEHMARFWLDLVRYADTHGMHFDNYREMWPYRDWVVESFNENKPYSTFITDQLAGDLYPEPTRRDLIASGFNRLNVTTNEGGSIYDEVFTRNVVDRTEAFGTVFLGLTTGCAVCHDHKFDPISQKDFYSLYAFFNSLDGRAMDENRKDHAPVIEVPSAEQEARLVAAEDRLDEVVAAMDAPSPELDAAQAAWEASLADEGDSQVEAKWTMLKPTDAAAEKSQLVIENGDLITAAGPTPQKDDYVITGELPGRVRAFRLLIDPVVQQRVGLSPNGNAVISEVKLAVAEAGADTFENVKLASAFASYEQPDGPYEIKYAIDGKNGSNQGWALGGHLEKGKRRVGTFVAAEPAGFEAGTRIRITIQHQSVYGQHLIGKFRIETTPDKPVAEAPVELGPWHMVGPFEATNVREAVNRRYGGEAGNFEAGKTIKYRDQDLTWTEKPDFTDGLVHELPDLDDHASATVLYRTIKSPIAQTITVLANTTDGIRITLNRKDLTKDQTQRRHQALVTTYKLDLKKGTNHLYLKSAHGDLNGPAKFSFAVRSPLTRPTGRLAEIANAAEASRSAEDAMLLTRFYRRAVSTDPAALSMRSNFDKAVAAKDKILKEIPTTLVYKELETPREAHLLIRGEYDQKGDLVSRDVPESLPKMAESLPKNRLGLAKWLLADDHPLTARVAVNRFWQQVFGTGLVKTSEDLGAQGEPPSHPELLDWLAVDFRDHGWDIKRLMKQMVMSETYRQSSAIEPDEFAVDPKNRYLARGPRHRLDAETLRDQALFVSGLMNDEMGGPSVKPPQPDGIWKAVAFVGSDTGKFAPSAGDSIYRRSLYIFWKRTAHAPMMSTFDAPNRESCTARRERTNTPMQALLLMNEQMYVESAIQLAERVMLEISPSDTPARITKMFELATGRKPTDTEVSVLGELLADTMKHFQQHPEAAEELLKIGQPNKDQTIDSKALATYTILANTILNLDEVVTKH